MIKLLISLISKFPAQTVYAHCDIPCGIYDPHQAQLAAHTIIRMITLINDVHPESDDPDLEERKKIIHQVSRLTAVKEEHAEIVKNEVRVIWGDYFKEEHLKDYPHLHSLVFEIMKLASKARQTVDREDAQKLLEKVQEFAEIFYKTKGLEPVRVVSPYPTKGEIVAYK